MRSASSPEMRERRARLRGRAPQADLREGRPLDVDVDAVGEQPRDVRAVAFDEWPRAAEFAAAPAEVAAGAAGHGRDEREAGWKERRSRRATWPRSAPSCPRTCARSAEVAAGVDVGGHLERARAGSCSSLWSISLPVAASSRDRLRRRKAVKKPCKEQSWPKAIPAIYRGRWGKSLTKRQDISLHFLSAAGP